MFYLQDAAVFRLSRPGLVPGNGGGRTREWGKLMLSARPCPRPGQVSCAGPALRRNGNIYIMIGRARGRAGPRLKMARTLSSSSAGAGLAGGCGLAGAWTRPELQVPGQEAGLV